MDFSLAIFGAPSTCAPTPLQFRGIDATLPLDDFIAFVVNRYKNDERQLMRRTHRQQQQQQEGDNLAAEEEMVASYFSHRCTLLRPQDGRVVQHLDDALRSSSSDAPSQTKSLVSSYSNAEQRERRRRQCCPQTVADAFSPLSSSPTQKPPFFWLFFRDMEETLKVVVSVKHGRTERVAFTVGLAEEDAFPLQQHSTAHSPPDLFLTDAIGDVKKVVFANRNRFSFGASSFRSLSGMHFIFADGSGPQGEEEGMRPLLNADFLFPLLASATNGHLELELVMSGAPALTLSTVHFRIVEDAFDDDHSSNLYQHQHQRERRMQQRTFALSNIPLESTTIGQARQRLRDVFGVDVPKGRKVRNGGRFSDTRHSDDGDDDDGDLFLDYRHYSMYNSNDNGALRSPLGDAVVLADLIEVGAMDGASCPTDIFLTNEMIGSNISSSASINHRLSSSSSTVVAVANGTRYSATPSNGSFNIMVDSKQHRYYQQGFADGGDDDGYGDDDDRGVMSSATAMTSFASRAIALATAPPAVKRALVSEQRAHERTAALVEAANSNHDKRRRQQQHDRDEIAVTNAERSHDFNYFDPPSVRQQIRNNGGGYGGDDSALHNNNTNITQRQRSASSFSNASSDHYTSAKTPTHAGLSSRVNEQERGTQHATGSGGSGGGRQRVTPIVTAMPTANFSFADEGFAARRSADSTPTKAGGGSGSSGGLSGASLPPSRHQQQRPPQTEARRRSSVAAADDAGRGEEGGQARKGGGHPSTSRPSSDPPDALPQFSMRLDPPPPPSNTSPNDHHHYHAASAEAMPIKRRASVRGEEGQTDAGVGGGGGAGRLPSFQPTPTSPPPHHHPMLLLLQAHQATRPPSHQASVDDDDKDDAEARNPPPHHHKRSTNVNTADKGLDADDCAAGPFSLVSGTNSQHQQQASSQLSSLSHQNPLRRSHSSSADGRPVVGREGRNGAMAHILSASDTPPSSSYSSPPSPFAAGGGGGGGFITRTGGGAVPLHARVPNGFYQNTHHIFHGSSSSNGGGMHSRSMSSVVPYSKSSFALNAAGNNGDSDVFYYRPPPPQQNDAHNNKDREDKREEGSGGRGDFHPRGDSIKERQQQRHGSKGGGGDGDGDDDEAMMMLCSSSVGVSRNQSSSVIDQHIFVQPNEDGNFRARSRSSGGGGGGREGGAHQQQQQQNNAATTATTRRGGPPNFNATYSDSRANSRSASCRDDVLVPYEYDSYDGIPFTTFVDSCSASHVSVAAGDGRQPQPNERPAIVNTTNGSGDQRRRSSATSSSRVVGGGGQVDNQNHNLHSHANDRHHYHQQHQQGQQQHVFNVPPTDPRARSNQNNNSVTAEMQRRSSSRRNSSSSSVSGGYRVGWNDDQARSQQQPYQQQPHHHHNQQPFPQQQQHHRDPSMSSMALREYSPNPPPMVIQQQQQQQQRASSSSSSHNLNTNNTTNDGYTNATADNRRQFSITSSPPRGGGGGVDGNGGAERGFIAREVSQQGRASVSGGGVGGERSLQRASVRSAASPPATNPTPTDNAPPHPHSIREPIAVVARITVETLRGAAEHGVVAVSDCLQPVQTVVASEVVDVTLPSTIGDEEGSEGRLLDNYFTAGDLKAFIVESVLATNPALLLQPPPAPTTITFKGGRSRSVSVEEALANVPPRCPPLHPLPMPSQLLLRHGRRTLFDGVNVYALLPPADAERLQRQGGEAVLHLTCRYYCEL